MQPGLLMLLPAPTQPGQALIAGISTNPALTAEFLPQMQTALDAVHSASCGAGTISIPVDTASSPGSSEDANLLALLGPSPQASLASDLLIRGTADLRASLSRLARATSGDLPSAPQDVDPSASSFIRQSLISASADISDTEDDWNSPDQPSADADNPSALALPIVVPADSTPAPVLAAFGAAPVSPVDLDAATPAQDTDSLAQTLPGAPGLPVPSLLDATTPPALAPVLHLGRVGLRPSASPAPPLPASLSAPTEMPPGASEPGAAHPELQQAAGGDAAGSPVFEALLRPRGSNPAPESTSTARPAGPQDHPGRAALSAKPVTHAVDSRPASAVSDSTAGSSNGASDNSNPDDSSLPRQPHSQSGAAASPAAQLHARNSAGEGPFNSGLSFETQAATLSGPAVSNDEARQVLGPESAAHVEPLQDHDPAASAGALREVSFKIEGADGAAVHLKFTERRGEVHVVTRTQDAGLSEKLASDLPGLRKAVEDSGMSADIWTAGLEPAALKESDTARSDSGPNSGNQPAAWFRQGDSGRRRQGGRQQGWADQIEDALDGDQGGRI